MHACCRPSRRKRLVARSPHSVVGLGVFHSRRVAVLLLALLVLLALARPLPCAARPSFGFKVLPPFAAGGGKGANKGGGNKGGGKGGGSKGGGSNGGNKGGSKGDPLRGIGPQPLSCYFATRACDFVFAGSASLAPVYPLLALRPDQPFSAAILHKKGNRPVVSASIKACRALTPISILLPSCPSFSVASPSGSTTGVRIAARPLSLGQMLQYGGACFTLDFNQMFVKIGSGPRGMTRLARGDGNTEFPESRRCIVFRAP